MYCTACGQQMVPGAQACPQCGRPVGFAVPPAVAVPVPVPYVYNRVRRHIQTLSILWLIYAVWILLHWVTVFPFLTGMFGHGGWYGGWSFWGSHMPWLLPFITIMLVLRAILSAATGLSLMQRAPWARILAIVAAIFTILKPITGTALAIYTLWVLAPSLSAHEWDGMSQRN